MPVTAYRADIKDPAQVKLSLPSAGVTVTFSPLAVEAASEWAKSAVQVGADGVKLVEDAIGTVTEAACDVVEGGVATALVGKLLLSALA